MGAFDVTGVYHEIYTDAIHTIIISDGTDTTSTTLVVLIIIYCWIRVSRWGQISIFIGIDNENTWHLSFALQINMHRWFLFCFGASYYGHAVRAIFIQVVGSVAVGAMPLNLAVLLENDNEHRPILQVIFLDRLHKHPRELWKINQHFRLQVFCPNMYGVWGPQLYPVDFSFYTIIMLFYAFAYEMGMWFRANWPVHFAHPPVVMPPRVTDIELQQQGKWLKSFSKKKQTNTCSTIY